MFILLHHLSACVLDFGLFTCVGISDIEPANWDFDIFFFCLWIFEFGRCNFFTLLWKWVATSILWTNLLGKLTMLKFEPRSVSEHVLIMKVIPHCQWSGINAGITDRRETFYYLHRTVSLLLAKDALMWLNSLQSSLL